MTPATVHGYPCHLQIRGQHVFLQGVQELSHLDRVCQASGRMKIDEHLD